MKRQEPGSGEKQMYVEPRVLATYSKEELEDNIRPHGPVADYTNEDPGCFGSTCGCGCGCGGI